AQVWRGAVFRAVARAEAASDPRYQENRAAVLEAFRRWTAELLLPLVYEREVRGALALGAKRSGGEYSAEDFRLLAHLIEMDRVKKDFVANICHELRTPVSTIIGYSEILREWDVSGRQREMLDRMINNGQELSGLMDNLMNFSRMEADGPSAQFEIVRLREILTGLELMTQRLIRERPIEFGVHVESSIEIIES